MEGEAKAAGKYPDFSRTTLEHVWVRQAFATGDYGSRDPRLAVVVRQREGAFLSLPACSHP